MIDAIVIPAAVSNHLEQLFAVVVTAGLVLGNFLMFTPWRNGQDPREQRMHTPLPTASTEHQNP